MTEYRPKLIEVALPLAAINQAAAAEGSVGHRPHPKNLHRWWARRPLAAARAVIWASLVDDPSSDGTLTRDEQAAERQRLFEILERLVKWENCNDPGVLAEARAEIDRCFPDGPPAILDPFAGGGAIPLEAQRLGLTALAGDLNPIAVLINKAMVEIPPRFDGMPPVHPDFDQALTTWERTQGLAADVEAYGRWMRDEAEARIGHLYPDATGPDGEKLTTIAWIWARTVESPDPSWAGHVPLVASWTLSTRSGRPKTWIEPIIDRATQTIRYEIREGGEPSRARTVERGNGTCIATGATIVGDYIKSESRAGRMGQQLMAVVAEGNRGRTYLPVTPDDIAAAACKEPLWRPEGKNPERLSGGTVYVYGLDEWWKLFTTRQLIALTTFSDLLVEVAQRTRTDALAAGQKPDGVRLRDDGRGADAYADAVTTYLAFTIDKFADFSCSLSTWNKSNAQIRYVFARQAIPMSWDFAEVNPFSDRLGSWISQLIGLVGAVRDCLGSPNSHASVEVLQRDARARVRSTAGAVISTDPPYYDNISYADLSDFFYVWLRRNLFDVWPDECSTLLTPKSDELIANRYRAGSKKASEAHFESGIAEFMSDATARPDTGVPMTIYYAYKATETRDKTVRSTGMGHVSSSCAGCWFRNQFHMAPSNGTERPINVDRCERARFVNRDGVSSAFETGTVSQ